MNFPDAYSGLIPPVPQSMKKMDESGKLGSTAVFGMFNDGDYFIDFPLLKIAYKVGKIYRRRKVL